MKKLVLLFVLISGIFISCQNSQNAVKESNNSDLTAVTDEITVVNIADFDSLAGNYVGQKVKLQGTVDHVCKHGGQRAFLVIPESDARVKITPDENIAAFNSEMEGDQVFVIGIVEEQRIDEDYLMEWEQEIKQGQVAADDKGEGSHLGGQIEKGGEEADISEEMNKINNLRQMMKDSGQDHLSFYSVLCTDYEVMETPTDEEENSK